MSKNRFVLFGHLSGAVFTSSGSVGRSSSLFLPQFLSKNRFPLFGNCSGLHFMACSVTTIAGSLAFFVSCPVWWWVVASPVQSGVKKAWQSKKRWNNSPCQFAPSRWYNRQQVVLPKTQATPHHQSTTSKSSDKAGDRDKYLCTCLHVYLRNIIFLYCK